MSKKTEQWKNFFLGLPDKIFYQIIRNYLGAIQSPYNKHMLLERLMNFIDSEKFQRESVQLLTPVEIRLLSAIRILETPSGMTLIHMFSQELKDYELTAMLKNLQERLWIYPQSDGIFELNPFFFNYEYKDLFTASALLKSVTVEGISYSLPWFNENFLLAVYSLLNTDRKWFKQDGSVTLRISQQIRDLFPVTEDKCDVEIIASYIRNILLYLDLAVLQEGTWVVQPESWKRLALTDDTDRLFYILAAASGCRHNLKETATVLKCSFLDTGEKTAFTKDAWFKYWTLLFHDIVPSSSLDTERLWSTLCEMEMLIPQKEGLYTPSVFTQRAYLSARSLHAIRIHTTGEVTINPQASFYEGFIMARISLLIKCDTLLHFELDKNCYYTTVNSRFTHDDLMEVLNRIQGNEIPQNLGFQLNQWHDEMNAVTVRKGILLEVIDVYARLIEQSGILEPYMLRKITPGAYLLEESTKDQWISALKKHGINYIPNPETVFPENTPRNDLPSLRQSGIIIENRLYQNKESSESANNRSKLVQALETMGFDEEEKNEWINRIDRKVIVFSSQIREKIIKQSKVEAKGLDNSGKLLLIEQSLNNPSLHLLITALDSNHKMTRIEVIPQKIDKNLNDHVLSGFQLPDFSDFTMRVRKMSNVRVILRSLL